MQVAGLRAREKLEKNMQGLSFEYKVNSNYRKSKSTMTPRGLEPGSLKALYRFLFTISTSWMSLEGAEEMMKVFRPQPRNREGEVQDHTAQPLKEPHGWKRRCLAAASKLANQLKLRNRIRMRPW
jgi:hypothetical protein